MKKGLLRIISISFIVLGFHIFAHVQNSHSSSPRISQERINAGVSAFSDTNIGTNGKSCKSCHSKPGEKPLEGRKVNAYLISSIQYCYNNAMKGNGVIDGKKLERIVDLFRYIEKE